ncbi:MAG TPA: DUF4276 family protein [Thermoanaerobaculia bacterium]
MVSEIRIYFEGGGNSRLLWRTLRRGFGQFLDPLRRLAQDRRIGWHLIPCGSRNETFKEFMIGLRTHPESFNVLLVDSEREVALPCWKHLERWDRFAPPGIPEERCHFMVQTVEAWLVADPETLEKFYGKGFRRNVLPSQPDVEAIPKNDVLAALDRATSPTQKGKYKKIEHCAELLQRLDSSRVRSRARHCDLLFRTLEAMITAK